MQRTRYPGVSPFTSEQQSIFYGRDKDIKKLQKLIALRSQVLVYAKSGIGKTSLLNAGVLPLLENKFNILKIRFTAYDKNTELSPVQIIINLLENRFRQNDETSFLDEIAQNTGYKKTLWHYFKQYNLLHSENEDFILVFDQFEELFSYPDEQIHDFKEQMHGLINDNLPNPVKHFIAEHPEIEEQTEVLFDDLNIKTVFAIRSDRLSLINKLTDKLPDIQKNFYELNPLDNEQAKQAIVNPAKDQGDFETKAFNFENNALDAIIKALSDSGKQNIETTQLQIICERIENIAQEKGKNSLNEEMPQIAKADLPKFDDIFLNFYQESIKKLKNIGVSTTADAQKFIEDQLIRNHQRISLDEIICFDYVQKETLTELVNSHLLRAERNSTGGFSYELSHDTLIEPILISRKRRKEKEEEARAQAEQQEALRLAEEKAEKERIEREKERKRQRQIIAIVSIAAVVSIAFGIFGFVNMRKAQEGEKKTIELTIKGYLRDAQAYMDKEEYEVAMKKYLYLRDSLNSKTPAVQKRINKCRELDSIGKLFYGYLNEIDSLIKSKDIEDLKTAGNIFVQIKTLPYKPGETKLQNRISTYQLKINNVIKENLRLAETMINADDLRDDAIKTIKKIEPLDPNNKQIKIFKEKYNL